MADEHHGNPFMPKGTLKGHKKHVTALATGAERSDILISASRDHELIVWKMDSQESSAASVGDSSEEPAPGSAMRALAGHNSIVSDVFLTASCTHAISSSYDKTLALWDVERGKRISLFQGHTMEVMSVHADPENKIIVSSGMDKTVRGWDIRGKALSHPQAEYQHTNYVSSVRYTSGGQNQRCVISCGWDYVVKKWDAHCSQFLKNIGMHNSPVNTMSISPDGTLCATGCKDGQIILWDVQNASFMFSLDGSSPINSICFAPENYWVCAGTDDGVVIWDLESRSPVGTIPPRPKKLPNVPWATAIKVSNSGSSIYVGTAAGTIECYLDSSYASPNRED